MALIALLTDFGTCDEYVGVMKGVIAGIDPHHDEKPYLAWMLMLQAGVMGSFLSLDLFMFFVFFEIVLVPM